MKNADIYQDVTDRIIRRLEDGVAPWRQPWLSIGLGMPKNAASNRQYNGVNVWLLMLTAETRGFDSNLWGTFNQWRNLGGHVNRGEKGTQIVFWNIKEETTTNPQTGEQKEEKRFFARTYTVFNLCQCGGEKLDRFRPSPTEALPFEDHDEAEYAIARTDADIRYGGNQAYFHKADDYIQLPNKDRFRMESEFYSTALHELSHWTGHETRLNRIDKLSRFGDESYAMEELVAEMSSAFLCASLGVENIFGERLAASYIEGWLKVLKSDRRAIFTASSAASEAADYVLSFSQSETEVVEDEFSIAGGGEQW